MGWESSGVVGFDLGPLLEGQMRTAKLKSAYNSLIIGPTGFGALSLRWIQFASVLRCARSSYIYALFTPQPLRAVRVLFSPMVSGWAGGWREEVCPSCISETVRCRKLMLCRDIG